jgi:hypothetical protein
MLDCAMCERGEGEFVLKVFGVFKVSLVPAQHESNDDTDDDHG